MTARRPAGRPVAVERKPWDWGSARLGEPAPCGVCGQPALLRHPDTGAPQHKTCEPPSTA